MAHRSRRGDRRLIQLGRALVARLSRAARRDLTVKATGFEPAALHQQWESDLLPLLASRGETPGLAIYGPEAAFWLWAVAAIRRARITPGWCRAMRLARC